jgi:hypothetical protein
MSQTKAQLLNPLGDFELTGQLVGVGATFSGNVSIAGTLTKQDVTNVDSVGVVTARSGVNISGGNLQVGGTNIINSGLALYNVDSIKLADSKELKLGSSDDLKLYHNGAHSYIDEVGSGSLKVRGNDIRCENASGVERVRIGTGGNGVSIGINTTVNLVTGSEVLAVRGYSSFKSYNKDYAAIYTHSEGEGVGNRAAHLLFNWGGANRGGFGVETDNATLILNNQNGISFRTGSTGLNGAEKLHISAAGNIGIQTNAPADAWLDIASSAGTESIRMRRLSSDVNVASNWALKPYGKNLYFREGSSSPYDRVHFTDTGNVVATGAISDSKGELRAIPRELKGSAYTLVLGDAGKCIAISSGGITVPHNVLGTGHAVTIINNSGSDQTITQAASLSLYNTADGSTGNRTLAGRGMATIWFSSGAEAYISGSGLS